MNLRTPDQTGRFYDHLQVSQSRLVVSSSVYFVRSGLLTQDHYVVITFVFPARICDSVTVSPVAVTATLLYLRQYHSVTCSCNGHSAVFATVSQCHL